jgi:hypothetical protein
MSPAVRSEVNTVRVEQAAGAVSSAGDFAQRRTDAWLTIIAEADQALIESGIPQG